MAQDPPKKRKKAPLYPDKSGVAGMLAKNKYISDTLNALMAQEGATPLYTGKAVIGMAGDHTPAYFVDNPVVDVGGSGNARSRDEALQWAKWGDLKNLQAQFGDEYLWPTSTFGMTSGAGSDEPMIAIRPQQGDRRVFDQVTEHEVGHVLRNHSLPLTLAQDNEGMYIGPYGLPNPKYDSRNSRIGASFEERGAESVSNALNILRNAGRQNDNEILAAEDSLPGTTDALNYLLKKHPFVDNPPAYFRKKSNGTSR